MKVLLLSAYDAQSHRYWAQGLQEMMPDWEWQLLSLPPRHFSWRVRGNPLYWALEERELLEQPHDLLLATSMVDLATLRGLVPALASVPTALYFHENQFAYPQHRQQHSLLEAQMVSLYSALAADCILFNSAYNRDSFLQGCAALLKRLPDRVPAGVVSRLAQSAQVLPVPLRDGDCEAALPWWPGPAAASGRRPLRLLWSARQEHDKGGEGLLRILGRLEGQGLDYELALTGEQFRDSPPVFAQIQRDYAHRLVQFGYVEEPARFRGLQAAADMVLSTALHEFQGLAVMQAVAAGCVPVVPDRLAYQELYGAEYRYASSPEDPEQEAQAAVERILALAAADRAAPSTEYYQAASLAARYRSLLQALQDSQ